MELVLRYMSRGAWRHATSFFWSTAAPLNPKPSSSKLNPKPRYWETCYQLFLVNRSGAAIRKALRLKSSRKCVWK